MIYTFRAFRGVDFVYFVYDLTDLINLRSFIPQFLATVNFFFAVANLKKNRIFWPQDQIQALNCCI